MINPLNKHHYLVCVYCFVTAVSAILTGCAGETAMVDALLREAKQQFAPDKRTRVFNVAGHLDGAKLVLSGEIHSVELRDQLLTFLKEKTQYDIVDSLVTLPHPSLQGKVFGVASVSVANIRTKPGHSEELATQVLLGTPLRILKRERGWLYVQTPEEYLGWTDDKIEAFGPAGYQDWIDRPKVIITASYSVSTSSKISSDEVVGDIVAGDIFAVVEESDKHVKVAYPDGREAFIKSEEAMPFDEWLLHAKDTPSSIVQTAKRFTGVPYLWGGTSVKGMDCSGYTKTIFFLNGVLLPRDANQQELVGEPIEIDDDYSRLQVGDLVFFGADATSDRPRRVTHVGIYLSDKKFIHESGDVHINSFDPADPLYSEYRTRSLLSARRIIGAGKNVGIKRFAETPLYKREL